MTLPAFMASTAPSSVAIAVFCEISRLTPPAAAEGNPIFVRSQTPDAGWQPLPRQRPWSAAGRSAARGDGLQP